MTDKEKKAAAEKITPADIADKITLAGDPLPIDPETGDIIEAELTENQRELMHKISGTIVNAAANGKIKESITPIIKGFNAFIGKMQTDEARAKLQALKENLQPIQSLFNELDELDIFLKAELKKEEYAGFTYEDIKKYTPGELLELRTDPNSLFYKALHAAKEAKAKAERVTIQHAKDIEYPLDKINNEAWKIFTDPTDGQLQITFNLLPKKNQLEATAYYSIDFESLGTDLKITKKLQPFDKRVYIAVSALFNAGNNVMTATQIHYAMGNTGKPGKKQIKKIDDALLKMTGARITLDNQPEHNALKGKYPLFQYVGSLLPIEKVSAIVNGQITDSAIHVFREPPLMTFAKERKQVTTIDVTLLQSPVSKTDANLLIDDYLLDRISKAKNGKNKSCRILYKTLYDRARIKEPMQKQRAPEKIEKYLSYYQQQNWINKYLMQKDGVKIYF